MDHAFAPPAQHWITVSSKLRRLRRGLALVVIGLCALAPLLLMGFLLDGAVRLWLLVAAALLIGVAVAWAWILIGRNWRSWGYAERDDDLLITHGVLFRKLVVVPYGRMQFVDVTAGPLARRFGLATLRLHTAAAATDATIPGLTDDEAARLRDRLAAL